MDRDLLLNGMKRAFKKDELESIAREILSSLQRGENATVIALSGDLGAGKTTLSQHMARELGVTENVLSPTFVIMKSYIVKDPRYAKLVHIDAYRLESEEEIRRLGWEAIMSDPANLILIEWPEKIPEVIPARALRVTLTHSDESTREIQIDKTL